MRLTIKGTGLIDCGGTVADLGKEEYSRRYHEKCASAHIKLGQLEDIEDELGVSLATLFKALKNGIWFRNEYESVIGPYHSVFNANGPILLLISLDHKFQYEFKFRDYGKTWALTREELEESK